jgi:hypothetical protein
MSSSVRDVHLRIRADGVGASRVQLLERVGHIARQHHVAIGVVEADHRDVAGRVPRCLDGDYAPVLAQRKAAGEDTEGAGVQRHRPGGEAARKRLAQHPAHEARKGGGDEGQLGCAHAHGGAHVDQPVDVVAVVVGEDHLRDIGERQPGGRHGVGQLLLARHLEAREGDVARGGDLAGVDQQQTLAVLDRPAVDRQRVTPGAGNEEVELAPDALAGKQKRALDAHASGLQRVDPHR